MTSVSDNVYVCRKETVENFIFIFILEDEEHLKFKQLKCAFARIKVPI